LDQSVLAGAGNIYRSEVLFATQIHPERSGRSLSHEQFLAIWKMLVTWMRVGVRYNRIITVGPGDCEQPLGRLRRQERLLIYKRLLCRRCDGAVSAWELGARRVYACLNCQR
jgi:endonuclease-8